MSSSETVSWFKAWSRSLILVSWKGDLYRVCCNGWGSAAGVVAASDRRVFFLGGLIGWASVNGEDRPSAFTSSSRRRFSPRSSMIELGCFDLGSQMEHDGTRLALRSMHRQTMAMEKEQENGGC